jgi:hypothetical protein
MSFGSLKYSLLINFKNIPGPTVPKKIVVIEADDYGGIRMPTAEVYEQLKAEGVNIVPSRYNLLDTLETADDLEALFDILHSVKGADGKPAVVSPFVNVANPDFEKIKTVSFAQYHYEPFTTTLQRYGRNGIMDTWRQGMETGIFMPELHGREHISVQAWLQQLQKGNKQVLSAFEKGFVAVSGVQGVAGYADEFRPEFYFTEESEKPFLHKSITEAARLFEQLFSYKASAFVPSNSVFHPDFEDTVFAAGIPFLGIAHKNPTPVVGGGLEYTSYTFRQKIKPGKLNYYIRNCAFEPNDKAAYSLHTTLMQVAAAFRWHKPAIISTHRVNFAGALDIKNRDIGLGELKKLLSEIVKRWPDVHFMSTRDMLKELKN